MVLKLNHITFIGLGAAKRLKRHTSLGVWAGDRDTTLGTASSPALSSSLFLCVLATVPSYIFLPWNHLIIP